MFHVSYDSHIGAFFRFFKILIFQIVSRWEREGKSAKNGPK